MKEISRRSFLRTSALAGAAAVLAGAAPLAAGAASPAAVPEENCLDSLGTAVASLGNGTPVLPSVVGLSRGSIMGYCENGIYTFKGIPYGTHQRFKYAAPVEQYGTPDQPTNALTNGSVSPQSNTQTEYYNPFAAAAFMTPSESDLFSTESQCLNLNVWTETLNSSAQKPVLVFIHGGGLQTGAALELKIYDSKYFADYTDCVFVSTNARLNYVGYMDLSAIGGDANVGIAAQYTYPIGNVWAEMGGNNSADAILCSRPGDAKCNLSAAQQEAAMRELLGSNYDQAARMFADAYPGHDLYDLRSLISFAGDPMTVHAAASAPAVYEYLVAYTMPYFGGMTMTHTSDLGFWFHSVDTVPYQIAGDEANAHHLSDQMASALAAFCATGDPSTRRLPWDRYTAVAPRTMVFDVRSACKDSSFDDGLQAILGH